MLNNHEILYKATESGCGENEQRKGLHNRQHLFAAFSFYGIRQGSISFFSFLHLFGMY